MTIRSHEPERTCVGCRAKASRQTLLRLRLSEDGALVPDPQAVMPGRGAWIHPDLRCFNQAVRKRAFGRAFRVSKPIDTASVLVWIGHTTMSETV